MIKRIRLFDLPLDLVGMDAAVGWIRERLEADAPSHVVTLNPEIVVRSQKSNLLAQAIKSAELVTPDGVGILWAAQKLCKVKVEERVTGVDLTHEAFSRFGKELRVYFLGGKPGVAKLAAANSSARYGITVAGYQHGYFSDENDVVATISKSGANLLLAGLGEKQEIFLYKYKKQLGVPVMMGVGGTLDVLAGTVKRMPLWSRRLRIEWLLRIASDPRRWPRGLRLLQFVLLALAEKQGNCRSE